MQYARLINEPIIKDTEYLSAKRDSLLLNQANIILADLNTTLKKEDQFHNLIKSDIIPRQIVWREDEISSGLIIIKK